MDFFRTDSGSMTPFLWVLIALAVLNIVFALMLKESPMIAAVDEKQTADYPDG
jgi:VIT1/CCC1 family predicted Fe2+/Mn2+ transporter